jgi:hypothetical protein
VELDRRLALWAFVCIGVVGGSRDVGGAIAFVDAKDAESEVLALVGTFDTYCDLDGAVAQGGTKVLGSAFENLDIMGIGEGL